MIEYLTTSLGDYLSLMASKKGISKSELEGRVKIETVQEKGLEIFFGLFGHSLYGVERSLRENAMMKKYDAIVDIKRVSFRTFFGLVGGFAIYGTGVKLNVLDE